MKTIYRNEEGQRISKKEWYKYYYHKDYHSD